MSDGASRAQERFVIIGAGQAGAWVAKTLRSNGFAGKILMIGEESHLPYERPPLSKAILSGQSPAESACLLAADAIETAGIDHWAGTRVEAIDRAACTIATSDGRTAHYDRLFLTTGSRARQLPLGGEHDTSRLHYLRTLDDATRLGDSLGRSRSLAVVGAGWIGLEAAATARQMGIDVVVLEAAPLPCMRSVPAEISRFLVDLHARNGVEVRTEQQITGIDLTRDRAVVNLAGEALTVDQVLVGIGVDPETGLAERAGLTVNNGIVVDETGQTNDPAIYAAGDVTNHPSVFHGRAVRLESWANAQNQAIVAARAALGHDARHADIPWIWSDQYTCNIQILGAPDAAARLVLRGNPLETGGCWLALGADDRAIGAVAVNAAKDLRVARKALEAGTTPDLVAWQDVAIPANRIGMA